MVAILAGGAVAMGLHYFSGLHWLVCTVLAAGFVTGANAPDWLEISWRTGANREKRHSLIAHRTITHWVALWAVAFGYCLHHAVSHDNMYWMFLLGFSASGLFHVLMDSATPLGVPWISPFKRIGAVENDGNI